MQALPSPHRMTRVVSTLWEPLLSPSGGIGDRDDDRAAPSLHHSWASLSCLTEFVFTRPHALDTISFHIATPPGYYIASGSYVTAGSSNVGRLGSTRASANCVVDGEAWRHGDHTIQEHRRLASVLPGARQRVRAIR